jgi:hypothetical protein
MEDLFGRDRLSEALREKNSMDGFDVVRAELADVCGTPYKRRNDQPGYRTQSSVA